MMRAGRLTALVLAAGGWAGAASPQDAPPSRLLVSAERLASSLRDPRLVVLHVGADSAAYLAGHIPGARFLRLSSIVVQTPDLPNELPPVEQLVSVLERVGVGSNSRIVLYGEGGGLAPARAFFTLDYLGLGDQTALLDGGLEGWRAAGLATSQEPVPGKPGTLQVRPRPELVVQADRLASRLHADGLVLVDARPPEEFDGRQPGGGVQRPGHLPGAVNFFWREALVPTGPPLLLPREVLERRFRELGIAPGDEIVVYCRTGI